MIKKLAWAAGTLVLALLLLAIGTFVTTGPARPPADSISASWLQPGPWEVAQQDFRFVDSSRPTAENRGVAGSPERVLNTTLWYPVGALGPLPLIIHSHGILSSRTEMPYLMEQLASHGYLVAAADFPLTSGTTEGGANAVDVVNQPADLSFILASLLVLTPEEKAFTGEIDTTRIGLSGYSLGGLTTVLATWHPRLREQRVAAAVTMAAPTAAFAPAFFERIPVPFLAISGTADALIEHRGNADDIPQRIPGAGLLTIEGASHLGFLGAAEPTFRFMDNPDSLGCSAVLDALDGDPDAAYQAVAEASGGIDLSRELPPICGEEIEESMHPGRQHMITQIAILSFFESVFGRDPERRQAAREALTSALARDFAEASFSQGRDAP